MKTLHIDELKDFAIRDMDRIGPGAEALLLHVPDLGGEQNPFATDLFAWGEHVTVTAIGMLPYSELEIHAPRSPGSEARMISAFTYIDDWNQKGYHHTADWGITPYSWMGDGDQYNRTNTLVLLKDLEEVGAEFSMVASPQFLESLNSYNESRRTD